MFSSDIKALGLTAAQGLVLTEGFYWDLNDQTRAFSKRFAAQFGGRMPTSSQAGVYSSVLHYLKAVDALKSKETEKVMAKMKEMPIDDPLFGKGVLRADGRVSHPMYLFGEEAGRFHRGVGSVQDARHHTGRGGIWALERGRLPAGWQELNRTSCVRLVQVSEIARISVI